MPAFEISEFRSRIEHVQMRLEQHDLSVLLLTSPENIYYLTGYQTSGYFAFQALAVPAAGDPVLLIRLVEIENVPEYSWLDKGSVKIWSDGEDVVAHTVELVESLAPARGRIGIEKQSWFLTADIYDRLGVALDKNQLIDASWLVDEVRTIKTPAEIGYLRRAAKIAEIEVQAALDAIRPGATEADVAAAVHAAGIAAGSEYTGLPQHIQSGHRRTVGHANWSEKKIEAGELLRLELYGCVERYHATCIRSVFVGDPDHQTQSIAEHVIAAQDQALAALRPGVSSKAVDALVRGPIREIRPDYRNRSGYSTGIGFPPRTAEWDVLEFNEYCDWEVREGMVFHILTAAQGIGISETVAITEGGAERLTSSLPRSLLTV